jgi:hypothetical protein
MVTNNVPLSTIGWTSLATGITGLAAMIFLILLNIWIQPFGTLNDIFNSVLGVSSAVLAWMLYAEHHSHSPVISRVALALAWIGALVAIIGSWLVISRRTGFVLAGWYTGIGFALIGLWLTAFCASLLQGDSLPHNLVIFGLIVGVAMALGVIGVAGVAARVDSMESLPWYLYIAYTAFLGIYFLYPAWTIWLGRTLLR